MGDATGFMTFGRCDLKKQSPKKRITHSREFVAPYTPAALAEQSSRCMDCGVPFCHQACPLGNNIPEFNRLIRQGHKRDALEALLSTNNFPEFTGRVCPAPCESACVLGINDKPVAIESIEMSLSDNGFAQGWIQPVVPKERLDKKVAIIGSGPAGLAAAQQLNARGYQVTVFERSPTAGGLLQWGIPDFKLEKKIVARRVDLLMREGIEFQCGVTAGVDITYAELRRAYDAILLACGATQSRDLDIPNRDARGVYLAQDYLIEANRSVAHERSVMQQMSARNKDVIIIGGGDTGADCVGTAIRQGARSVTQIEIMEQPPNLGPFPKRSERPPDTPWPQWPRILRTSSSHEEGGRRAFAVRSVSFETDVEGRVSGLRTCPADSVTNSRTNDPHRSDKEILWPCQLALIAIGFSGPEQSQLLTDAQLKLTGRGTVWTDEKSMTSTQGVFAAGDMRRGQSLVVWAIAEGRKAAEDIHNHLSAGTRVSAPVVHPNACDRPQPEF